MQLQRPHQGVTGCSGEQKVLLSVDPALPYSTYDWKKKIHGGQHAIESLSWFQRRM
jgi:hypothetical protein